MSESAIHSRMNYYPVMLDLRGKPVLFVGGGWETEHKVRGLLEAGARVTVISPFEHPELSRLQEAGRIVWHRRGFLPGDLVGFMLCVSHPVNRFVNAMIAKEARAGGVWLNAVDDPQYCDFILPSVHRQGELLIAVSTSGAAPALGVRIKQKLARQYGPEYGEYLGLLRSLRPLVLQTYPDDFEARKAAWYRMIDGEALGWVKRGDLEQAREVLLNALYGPESINIAGPGTTPDAINTTIAGTTPGNPIYASAPLGTHDHASLPPREDTVPTPSIKSGKVYLVGAGLGDPDLLTVKAARLLSEADVVLYDRLISQSILQTANPAAEMVYVGKEYGEQERVQDQIHEHLLHYARAGKTVVRLKSGDPMVYGRGGEELVFLAEKGVEAEVIPGISSALAAPTLAGIPLTLRGIANGFAVLSGQGKNGLMPDFRPYAHSDTLVILMGVKERVEIAQQLIGAGRNPADLSAFIENASQPNQRVIETTLHQIAQGQSQVKAPAVWVIGEVVRVRSRVVQEAIYAV